MAARTGRPGAVRVLLARGADVDQAETWGGHPALMWAVAEHRAEAVALLVAYGADVDARSRIYPVADAAGSEGPEPEDAVPGAAPVGYSNGGFTPLLFAAREGDLASARLLVAGGGRCRRGGQRREDPLGLAVYNGNYAVASFRLDAGSRVDHPDAEGFTPLFWAVDRRNMEWNPGFALAPQLRGFAAHPLCHDRRRLAGDESAHALVHLRERGGPGRLGAAAKGARAGRFVRGGGCSGRWGGSRAYPGAQGDRRQVRPRVNGRGVLQGRAWAGTECRSTAFGSAPPSTIGSSRSKRRVHVAGSSDAFRSAPRPDPD